MIEGKYSKVNSKKLYDKVVPNTEPIDVNDDIMYMQELINTGKEDKVGKAMDVSANVALLQAIFAILLVSGKTLHEQSLVIARLSSHPQPEVSLFPSSSCFCKTQSRVCCEVTTTFIDKVTSMVDKASAGVVWFRQLCSALYLVKERTLRSVLLIGRVRIQLTIKD